MTVASTGIDRRGLPARVPGYTAVAAYRKQGALLMSCGDDYESAAEYYALKCAWCQGVIGESSIKGSHGICEACQQRELEIRRATCRPPAAIPHGAGKEGAD